MASQQNMPDGEQTGRPEEVAAFSVTRRGYDRDAVDAYLREHQAERREELARREKAEGRAADLEKELDRLRRQLAQADEPSYGNLGDRAAQLLNLAETQADDVMAEARDEAEKIRQAAQGELDRERQKAVDEARSIRESARAEADQLVASARDRAARVESEASAKADDQVKA